MLDRTKKLNRVLIACLAILVVVIVIDTTSNRRVIRELQQNKNAIRKKSKKTVDSLQKIIKLDSVILNGRLDSVNKRIESLRENYETSQKELDKLQQDISIYLVSSDSIRFALFTELITEMD